MWDKKSQLLFECIFCPIAETSFHSLVSTRTWAVKRNVPYYKAKLVVQKLTKQKLSYKACLNNDNCGIIGQGPRDIKLAYEDNESALVVSQSLISSCTWGQTGTKVLMGSLVIKPISSSSFIEFPDWHIMFIYSIYNDPLMRVSELFRMLIFNSHQTSADKVLSLINQIKESIPQPLH